MNVVLGWEKCVLLGRAHCSPSKMSQSLAMTSLFSPPADCRVREDWCLRTEGVVCEISGNGKARLLEIIERVK